MKRVLASELPKSGRPVKLPEAEAEHAVKVLRLRDGDSVEALDGRGNSAIVTLRTRGGEGVAIEFLDSSKKEKTVDQSVPPLILEMAILKGDAMEWVVEKAVELGVRTLIPTVTAHTVVQIKQKGPETFRQRWQKIADQALKQCGRLTALSVETPVALEELLARQASASDSPRLWFDEGGRHETPYLQDWLQTHPARHCKAMRLLVGPEGGWSQDERELLTRDSTYTHRIGLGPWVLRAETAAIFSISLTSAAFRSISALDAK